MRRAVRDERHVAGRDALRPSADGNPRDDSPARELDDDELAAERVGDVGVVTLDRDVVRVAEAVEDLHDAPGEGIDESHLSGRGTRDEEEAKVAGRRDATGPGWYVYSVEDALRRQIDRDKL